MLKSVVWSYVLLLITILFHVCTTLPVSDEYRRKKRFLAKIGKCPPQSQNPDINCETEALRQQCLTDEKCEIVGQLCCKHPSCPGIFVCTKPLTSDELGLPHIRSGSCYNKEDLMNKLEGICTEEASCGHDDDCANPEHKCCLVDKSCGQTKQCYVASSITPHCVQSSRQYAIGQEFFKDSFCEKCICTKKVIAQQTKAIAVCVTKCIDGVPIDSGLINYKDLKNEQGFVNAGIAVMNMGIQHKNNK